MQAILLRGLLPRWLPLGRFWWRPLACASDSLAGHAPAPAAFGALVVKTLGMCKRVPPRSQVARARKRHVHSTVRHVRADLAEKNK